MTRRHSRGWNLMDSGHDHDECNSQNSGSDDELHAFLDAAHSTIFRHFNEDQRWGKTPKDTCTSPQETANLEGSAMKIIRLLERIPMLASEKFPCWAEYQEDYHPLSFFVWCNLDIQVLERIYQLYPQAVSEEQGRYPDMLQMASSIWTVSDRTLCWLVSKCYPGLLTALNNYRATETSPCPLDKLVRTPVDLVALPVLQPPLKKSTIVVVRILEFLLALKYPYEIMNALVDIFPRHLCIVLDDECLKPSGASRYASRYDLSASKFKALQLVLPRLRTLHLFWCVNVYGQGVERLLASIAECQALESVSLDISLPRFSDHEASALALQHILQSKPATMQLQLEFRGCWAGLFDKIVLLSLLEGLQANPSPILKELNIHVRGIILYQIQLERICDYCSTLTLRGPLIKAEPSCSPRGLGGHSEGDEIDDITSCGQHFTSIVMGIPDACDFFIQAKMEVINTRGDRIFGPRIQTLTCLKIEFVGNDFYDEDEHYCMDVTNSLVTALKVRSLTELTFIAKEIAFDDELEDYCGSHKFQVAPVLEALTNNSSLVTLELEGLSFRHASARAVPSMLLQIVESKDSALERLSLLDDTTAYTINDNAYHWAARHYHVDYETSVNLQYTLWMKEFGRRKMLNKSCVGIFFSTPGCQ